MKNKFISLFLLGWLSLPLPKIGSAAETDLPAVSSPTPLTAPVAEKNIKTISKTSRISGVINLSEKYDTNFDLAGQSLNPSQKGSTITELSARLAYQVNWAHAWLLDVDFLGLADWPERDLNRSWYLGNVNFLFGYGSGSHTLSFSNDLKYVAGPREKILTWENIIPRNEIPIPPGNQPFNRNFRPPDQNFSVPPGDSFFGNNPEPYVLTGFDLPQNDLDFLRNSSVMSYRRKISPLWRVGAGYDNITTIYPDHHSHDFSLNGWFLEIRNNWTPEFSTSYSYSFHFSLWNSGANMTQDSSQMGYLHTAELGANWFFTRRDSLNGTYTFQMDDSSGQSANEYIWPVIDDRGGQEFFPRYTHYKHKGSLLYLHLFPHRITLSVYAELMRRSFSEQDSGFVPQERNDFFLLSSLWLKVPIIKNVFGRASYIYRWDRFSEPREIFQDHIFQLGVEYQF